MHIYKVAQKVPHYRIIIKCY